MNIRLSIRGAAFNAAMRLAPLIIAIAVAGAAGCGVSSDDPGEGYAPAAPRGVRSISGNGLVIVVWYGNTEPDLAGYQIWRSLDPQTGYERIASVSANETQYVDGTVQNGTTYYYAVLAFDEDGYESGFNPELVEDTPRPDGRNVTLRNYRVDPSRAGFIFASGANGPVHWDLDRNGFLDRGVDIFFGRDDERGINYIYSDHDDLLMQDLGYRDSLDDADVAPMHGYTIISVEALEGHVYAVLHAGRQLRQDTGLRRQLRRDDVRLGVPAPVEQRRFCSAAKRRRMNRLPLLFCFFGLCVVSISAAALIGAFFGGAFFGGMNCGCRAARRSSARRAGARSAAVQAGRTARLQSEARADRRRDADDAGRRQRDAERRAGLQAAVRIEAVGGAEPRLCVLRRQNQFHPARRSASAPLREADRRPLLQSALSGELRPQKRGRRKCGKTALWKGRARSTGSRRTS